MHNWNRLLMRVLLSGTTIDVRIGYFGIFNSFVFKSFMLDKDQKLLPPR